MGERHNNLQLFVKNYLKLQECVVYNIVGHTRQEKGIPDLLASIKGKFTGIEIKIEKDPLRPEQKLQLRLINESGGLGVIVRQVKDIYILAIYKTNVRIKFSSKTNMINYLINNIIDKNP
jgi:hypothetical protein